MKSAFQSVWFWILLFGLLLILIGALIAGGTKEFNGWFWGFLIAGIIIALVGILIAFMNWNCDTRISSNKSLIETSQYNPSMKNSPMYHSSLNIPSNSSAHITSNSPIQIQSSPMQNPPIQITSPLTSLESSSPIISSITPTVVSKNIPQAQRGFSTTSLDISSLSPDS